MATTTPPPAKPHFFEDLAALKQDLIAMGALVEARVSQAMRALTEKDLDSLDLVTIGDAEVNARQMTIDDRAFKLVIIPHGGEAP